MRWILRTIIQKGTVMEPVYPDYQSCTLSIHIYPKLYALFVLTGINNKGTIAIFTWEVTEFYMVLPLFLWYKKVFWKKNYEWLFVVAFDLRKMSKRNTKKMLYFKTTVIFIIIVTCILSSKSMQVKVFPKPHCLPNRKPGWNFLRLPEDWFKQC